MNYCIRVNLHIRYKTGLSAHFISYAKQSVTPVRTTSGTTSGTTSRIFAILPPSNAHTLTQTVRSPIRRAYRAFVCAMRMRFGVVALCERSHASSVLYCCLTIKAQPTRALRFRVLGTLILRSSLYFALVLLLVSPQSSVRTSSRSPQRI